MRIILKVIVWTLASPVIIFLSMLLLLSFIMDWLVFSIPNYVFNNEWDWGLAGRFWRRDYGKEQLAKEKQTNTTTN